jgi:hypothetical protein
MACGARFKERARVGCIVAAKKATKKATGKKVSPKKAPRPAARDKAETSASASKLIDARIKEFPDWRGETLTRMRRLLQQADPDVVEEWKWDIPVWSHDGIICTGETYKDKVKLTFAKGAALPDPARLFNSSLEGNTRRAIDLFQGDEIDEKAFKSLVRAAAALNSAGR